MSRQGAPDLRPRIDYGSSEAPIRAALRGHPLGRTVGEVAAATGLHLSTVRKALRRMEAQGRARGSTGTRPQVWRLP
jgi:DNA-binding MarR family transcriptional regulator